MRYWGPSGAGYFLICLEDNTILLLRRANWVGQGGTWGIPGGALAEGYYDDHSPQIPGFSLRDFHKHARREVIEELGSCPPVKLLERTAYVSGKWKFVTFIVSITKEEKARWTPTITFKDKEHVDARWFPIDKPPRPLHFGVAYTLWCSRTLRAACKPKAKNSGALSKEISHANHRQVQLTLPGLQRAHRRRFHRRVDKG